jgi:hypothetical protein
MVLDLAKVGHDANGNPLYHCAYTNSPELQGSNHKDVVTYEAPESDEKGQIDHKIDVAEHWNHHGGNNMTQDQRNDWYDRPDNLRFLWESCNKAKKGKPSRTYTPEVDPNFREPNDKQ